MAASRLVQPQRALKRRISRRILSRRDILYQILLFGVVCCGISLGVLGACGLANMWEAVFADVGVSVIAILNASRALRPDK